MPDGTVIRGVPDGMTKSDLIAKLKNNGYEPAPTEPTIKDRVNTLASTGRDTLAGLARGAASLGVTLATPYDLLAGNTKTIGNPERRKAIDDGFSDMGVNTDSNEYAIGKFGGEMAGTAGIGGGLAAAARLSPRLVATAPNLINAVGTNGMVAGTAGMPTRVVGGGIAGAATAAATNPEDAPYGAIVGGGLPALVKVAGVAGRAAGSALAPLSDNGQKLIRQKMVNEFATNPENALKNLAGAKQIVEGSQPTVAMAAGDNGIAALSRTLENASPDYASNLSLRRASNNDARTKAMESIAGNQGKISVAEAARDAVTDPMRDSVLKAAGKLSSQGVVDGIESLLKKPDNAGKIPQVALKDFRNRIAGASENGDIDARALYAIRKDVNLMLNGKLSGEDANLRYASGQLIKVKELIDDAIDLASRKVPTTGTELQTAVNKTPLASYNPNSTEPAKTSWRDYLSTYRDKTVPINQMEKLSEVLKSIQTGTVSSDGNSTNLIISGAKLNNVLKNQGEKLSKVLSPEQMQSLRTMSADLNAAQLAETSGVSGRSNTLQNIAQNNILTTVLGNKIGGSTPATAGLGRLLQLPYGAANKQINEKLGDEMLDPAKFVKMMSPQQQNALSKALGISFDKNGKYIAGAAARAPSVVRGQND